MNKLLLALFFLCLLGSINAHAAMLGNTFKLMAAKYSGGGHSSPVVIDDEDEDDEESD